MGQIVTFYSYKGGVGRTMALANVAVLLARWGYKVLAVDWDLEAPGLEHFFKPYLDWPAATHHQGVIDLLHQASARDPLDWRRCLLDVRLRDSKQTLHLLTAGTRDEAYHRKV